MMLMIFIHDFTGERSAYSMEGHSGWLLEPKAAFSLTVLHTVIRTVYVVVTNYGRPVYGWIGDITPYLSINVDVMATLIH